MIEKELTCINCPLGCALTIRYNEEKYTHKTLTEDDIRISGNKCPKGVAYGKKEILSPTRIVTSSMRVKNGNYALVSVKTAAAIPKEKIRAIMKHIRKPTVNAPIAIGDILISNVANTGVNIVATRTITKKQ
ncbi:MAG TPA: DUF1667 domain-containing protein [Treponemataceae bacterium]|nr:DUF1667 domain-containing protein [Treponemataceae bacterium]